MSSAVRHFSTDQAGQWFAAAEFEELVHIYRTGQPEPERLIYTYLDFGGNRLAIVPQKDILIAGAYHVHGIEGYSLSSGRRCWQRKDLKKVQHIRKNPRDDTVSCFFEDRAGVVLDSSSGEVLSTYRGVKDVFFSPTGDAVLEEARPKYRLVQTGGPCFKISAESFALLDVAFSREFVAVSEVGASVRVFSLASGDLVGTYRPKPGYHVLVITFEPAKSLFVGLLWGYESAGDYALVHISSEGEEVRRIEIEQAYVSAFFEHRTSILLPSGRELSLLTGDEIFRYALPNKVRENA